jgi:hypothetical protein
MVPLNATRWFASSGSRAGRMLGRMPIRSRMGKSIGAESYPTRAIPHLSVQASPLVAFGPRCNKLWTRSVNSLSRGGCGILALARSSRWVCCRFDFFAILGKKQLWISWQGSALSLNRVPDGRETVCLLSSYIPPISPLVFRDSRQRLLLG